jgi:hypothetical protein
MINAQSSSPYIVAHSSGSLPFIGSSSNPVQGMVRVNGSRVEVFDSSGWVELSNQVYVGMTPVANDAISWAIKRMEEERTWGELAESNSAVKIALDNLEEARRQLSITAQLARDYETTS